MTRARILFAFLAALTVSGCIPHDEQRPIEPTAAPVLQRIEPDMASLNQPQLWDAQPADGNVIDVPGGTYTIQAGDTLHGIGLKTGVGYETLVRANQLSPGAPLTPGRQLTVPAGRYHVVKAGESGIAIARAHNVHWSEIVALNALVEPFIIHTDQRLLLPAGSAEHAPTTLTATPHVAAKPDTALEARAAAFTLDDVVAGGNEPAQPDGYHHGKIAKPSARHPLAAANPVIEPKHFTDATFAWPLSGRVISHFGGAGSAQVNHGIDIATASGSLVKASASGVAAFVGQVSGYGGTVILRHGDGWLTIYSHVAQVSIVRGVAVRRGQVIAVTGSDAMHFEIRQHRTPIDPLRKLG